MTNNHNRLNKQEIDWMENNAECFADEDKRLKECTEDKELRLRPEEPGGRTREAGGQVVCQ